MTRRISDKSKQILHMGEGKGKDYVPYILTSEFNSLGTTSIIKMSTIELKRIIEN